MSQFDTDTAVTQAADGSWQGTLNSAWNIGDKPNGGYMLSCTLAALRQAMPHPHCLSVTTHYLRPGIADAPFAVRVEMIRAGRTLSTARASLSQDGKPRLEILAAFGNLDESVGVDRELTLPAPDIPAPEDCLPRDGATQGVALPIASRLDVRLHPDLAVPGSATTARVAGWIRFADGRTPDAGCLPLFTDTFPPSPFSLMGVIGWVPTLELTVHVRRKPAAGWIQAQFTCEDLQQGRMVESGLLWDSEGQLVAQSRQLGLVMKQG